VSYALLGSWAAAVPSGRPYLIRGVKIDVEFRRALRSLAVPDLSWLIFATMDGVTDQDAKDADEPRMGDIRDYNGRLEVHDGSGWLPLTQLPNPPPRSPLREHNREQDGYAPDGSE
jgi:hypothetical protein